MAPAKKTTMSTERYRFKVGTFECIAVSDGTHTYTPPTFPPPATFLFANAPKKRLEQVLREHDLQPEQWAEWISPYICVVVNTGKHQVLVDTGAGDLDPNTGKLLQNLHAEEILPEDIDTVILTHGHPDHIGGNTAEGKQPDWYAAVDFAPEHAVTTRRRLLNRAATEKALVLAFHFPFPGLGYVFQKGEGWQWQPIETMV